MVRLATEQRRAIDSIDVAAYPSRRKHAVARSRIVASSRMASAAVGRPPLGRGVGTLISMAPTPGSLDSRIESGVTNSSSGGGDNIQVRRAPPHILKAAWQRRSRQRHAGYFSRMAWRLLHWLD